MRKPWQPPPLVTVATDDNFRISLASGDTDVRPDSPSVEAKRIMHFMFCVVVLNRSCAMVGRILLLIEDLMRALLVHSGNTGANPTSRRDIEAVVDRRVSWSR